MPTIMTPEHMQLLSDQTLDREARRETASGSADDKRRDRGVARAARFEQRRRRGETPTSDAR